MLGCKYFFYIYVLFGLGYTWVSNTVLSIYVYTLHSRKEFKSLPNLIQVALNATNICFEAVGEVELLSTIALRAQQTLRGQQVPDFGKIAQMSAAGAVGLYASTLGKFVQYHGGGPQGFIAIKLVPAVCRARHWSWARIFSLQLLRQNSLQCSFSFVQSCICSVQFDSPKIQGPRWL